MKKEDAEAFRIEVDNKRLTAENLGLKSRVKELESNRTFLVVQGVEDRKEIKELKQELKRHFDGPNSL